MAQPTIYADIDCDGQVEVKVNNDTGYDCTIITSTGINETISSTATDVYRNYNLTSSDWVKVVAAQDATIAANKLTGTIKYITSVTTTPTPTTTTPTPTTTTTTTPAGGATPISGGAGCLTATDINSIGVANKYLISIDDTNQYWYNINVSKAVWSVKKIYINTTDTINLGWIGNNSCTDQNNYYGTNTWSSGVEIATMPWTIDDPLSNNGTFKIWIMLPLGASAASYELWIDD